MEYSIMLSTRTSSIVSYWTVHIIHCNGGRFKDDNDDNKEHIFSNLRMHLNFLIPPH